MQRPNLHFKFPFIGLFYCWLQRLLHISYLNFLEVSSVNFTSVSNLGMWYWEGHLNHLIYSHEKMRIGPGKLWGPFQHWLLWFHDPINHLHCKMPFLHLLYFSSVFRSPQAGCFYKSRGREGEDHRKSKPVKGGKPSASKRFFPCCYPQSTKLVPPFVLNERESRILVTMQIHSSELAGLFRRGHLSKRRKDMVKVY